MSSRSSAYLPSNVNINDNYTNCLKDTFFPENKLDLSLESFLESNVEVLSISSSSSVNDILKNDKTVSTHSSTNNVFNDTVSEYSIYAHDTVYQDRMTKQKIHDSIVMKCSWESKIMFDVMVNGEKLSGFNILSYISSPFKGDFYNLYFDKQIYPADNEFSGVGYKN